MSTFKRDLFSPEVSFSFEEASEVDGSHVLGKVSGQFFVPEGFSRNKRFYSKKLWENVLKSEEVQSLIKDKRMFGTISHEQSIDDKALLEGKMSHIVSKLEIRENEDGNPVGFGEALILNTPAGQILNTVLRAGSKLFVSSRANGKYSGTKNGVPAVDEGSYQFKTFDFVLDPGFMEANPQLVEAIDNIVKEGENTMFDKEIFESLTKENINLKDERTSLMSQVSETKKEIESLKEEVSKKDAKIEVLQDSSKLTDAYRLLGTPEEIDSAFDASEKLIKQYKELGSPAEIKEALSKSISLLEKYKQLGSPSEVNSALEKSKKFVLETRNNLEKLGSFSQIEEALDKAFGKISEYKELGTPEEISEAFDKMEKHVARINEETKAKKVKDLAEELSVPVESVETLFGKISEEEIRKVLGRTVEVAKTQEKFKVIPTSADNKIDEKKLDEQRKATAAGKSRVSRLVESMSK